MVSVRFADKFMMLVILYNECGGGRAIYPGFLGKSGFGYMDAGNSETEFWPQRDRGWEP
jgi:poly-beta-hydroxyalkanoate depolymerase